MPSDDPYLFDDLSDPLPSPPAPVYTTPVEQATFDIMELVDSFFRASVTVEEYDCIQKKVKGILLEAFDEKNNSAACHCKRTLLLLRDNPE